jgi:TetR/AcrR family transcriptional regulator, transcriptional repressor for nem operon
MADTKTRLLDAATKGMQTHGYNAYSFHDLSASVGIKTASIHYHFPTKAALGEALASRYTAQFMAALGDADSGTPEDCLRRYAGLFRAALHDGRMCLCGMIGAEIDTVPEQVARQVRSFFETNHIWLAEVFVRMGKSPATARTQARLFLAILEGAMIIARVGGELSSFDEVADIALSQALV